MAIRKDDYIKKMVQIFNDVDSFQLIPNNPTVMLQKGTFKILDRMRTKKYLDYKIERCDIDTTSTNLPLAYGLVKAHKVDYPLRPVISTIGSPTRKLEELLSQIIKKSIVISKTSIKNSHNFLKLIENVIIPSEHIFVSFDVVAMFPNIPYERVENAIKKRWDLIKINTKIPKKQFLDAIKYVFHSVYFKFNNKFYKQKFGTPIGSVLSPVLAEMVMEDLENEVFQTIDFNIDFYARYVDDSVLSVHKNNVNTLLNIFNSIHPRLQFTVEIETEGKLNFLDLTLIRTDERKIITDWHRKEICSGRTLSFLSNHSIQNKIGIIKNLIDRALKLSNPMFHEKNIVLCKQILFLNHYPFEFIEKHTQNRINYIKDKKNDQNIKNRDDYNALNTVVVPYFGRISKILKSMLGKLGLHTIFRVPFKSNTIVRLGKDRYEKLDKKDVIYKINCNDCNASYIGQTRRALRLRKSEHENNFHRNSRYHSVLSKHKITHGHEFNWNDIKILYHEKNQRKREFMEMLFIKREGNKAINLKRDISKYNKVWDTVINWLR